LDNETFCAEMMKWDPLPTVNSMSSFKLNFTPYENFKIQAFPPLQIA